MIRLSDALLLAYPVYQTSILFHKKARATKRELLYIVRVWYVIGVVGTLDFATLGYLPLIDTLKAISIGVACVPALQDIVCETLAQVERKIIGMIRPVARQLAPLVEQHVPAAAATVQMAQQLLSVFNRLLFSDQS